MVLNCVVAFVVVDVSLAMSVVTVVLVCSVVDVAALYATAVLVRVTVDVGLLTALYVVLAEVQDAVEVRKHAVSPEH